MRNRANNYAPKIIKYADRMVKWTMSLHLEDVVINKLSSCMIAHMVIYSFLLYSSSHRLNKMSPVLICFERNI